MQRGDAVMRRGDAPHDTEATYHDELGLACQPQRAFRHDLDSICQLDLHLSQLPVLSFHTARCARYNIFRYIYSKQAQKLATVATIMIRPCTH